MSKGRPTIQDIRDLLKAQMAKQPSMAHALLVPSNYHFPPDAQIRFLDDGRADRWSMHAMTDPRLIPMLREVLGEIEFNAYQDHSGAVFIVVPEPQLWVVEETIDNVRDRFSEMKNFNGEVEIIGSRESFLHNYDGEHEF